MKSTTPTPLLAHEPMLATAFVDGTREAVISGGERYSYTALSDASHRLARALQMAGLENGDRVAVFAENGWPAVVAVFATWIAGGVLVPINAGVKEDKLAYLLTDSGAKALVTDARLAGPWLWQLDQRVYAVAAIRFRKRGGPPP